MIPDDEGIDIGGSPKRHAGAMWACDVCGVKYKPLLPFGGKLHCPECCAAAKIAAGHSPDCRGWASDCKCVLPVAETTMEPQGDLFGESGKR